MYGWLILLRVLPYAALAAVGAWGAYSLTSDHYNGVIAKMELKHQQEIAAAQAHVIEEVARQQEITNQTAADYETKIAKIRAYYSNLLAGGMREQSKTSGGSLPAVPHATSKPDGPARCDRLSTELRMAADIQTQRLLYLQEWVRKQQAEAQR